MVNKDINQSLKLGPCGDRAFVFMLLQVISKDVRVATSHIWTLVMGPVIFVWYVLRLCCNEPVMDIAEDDILMSSVEGGEQAAH